MPAGMTKTAGTTLTFRELVDDFKVNLRDGHEDHLGDAVTYGDVKGGLRAVPHRHKNLTLIVRIYQPHQVAEDNSVLVAESGAWEENGRKARISDVDGKPGWNQLGLTRLDRDVAFKTGTKVKTCRAVRCVFRKRNGLAQTRVKNLELDVLHDSDRQ